MDKKLFSDHMNLATLAAKKAGSFIINSKQNLNKINSSKERDIKLEIDIRTEKLIREILSISKLAILGEEYGLKKNNDNGLMWVVDPLDGTANYNRGIPISCVSIALVNKYDPILGVILDFNNNDIYKGGIYAKATKNDESISVSSINKTKKGTLMTGLPINTDYSNQGLKALIDDFQNWKKIRMIGSAAMAAAYVASGMADFYKEKGTNIWDIAAGVAIVRAAGGEADIINLKQDHSLDIQISNGKFI